MPDVEDLKSLMALMIADYFEVVDYFDSGEGKRESGRCSETDLPNMQKNISNFEPPKNADQTEEYVYLQDQFSETLLKFAETLEKEGIF